MKEKENEVRLQKILSRAGIASRRKAEELIREGRVTVNGRIVRELGSKVKEDDLVKVDGIAVSIPKRYRYFMVYKPRGFVTTMKDPQGRPTVAELLPEVSERLFPVGRLDFDSEGLLFMTNDGDFAFRIQHPRFQISKVYRVKVKGHFTPEHAELFSGGLALEDGLLRPDEVKIEKVLSHHTWLTVSIREGRKRVIRRAMKKLGFQVIRLVRIKIGKIELGNLKPGRYRELGAEEISELLS